MRNIEIMFNDGVIGNKALLLSLSALTTGNLNSKLKPESKKYVMKDILPSTYDYIIPPLSDEELKSQANSQLLAFMSLSPGASQYLKVDHAQH